MSFKYLDNRGFPRGISWLLEGSGAKPGSSVCRIVSSEIKPLLQFLLIDLKPNPARSTHTKLAAPLKENLLPFKELT